ncbi:ABC transporter ATP-binding protein [Halovivax gelatinilyticus]|uniref:ABC transporter ATP-binding protein n=1 Tax=Halovivax gelatinilyticus TaxID=2961597 RepID=UPI0020CA616F|nr:ABC transporter ATP-binding protein [Halovivax gelatinilyticus]
MTAIQTAGLTKRFGDDVLAVDDLDLAVEKGEVFGFLGPNGAGKSTTINLLLNFIRPTTGRATVMGHDVQTESRAVRERIGVLPEGAALYDRLTGVEHIEWAAETKGVDAEPYAILDRVGLDADDGDRAVGGYSKGMAQRLGFAMALLGDPDILILDEPSSGLDPTGMQEMRSIIRAEADRGRTVFFSSHILGEVEATCDRIAIMNEGRLVTTGTLDDLRDRLALDQTITLEVDEPGDGRALESIDGVRRVETGASTITATCADPTIKIDVVEAVAARTTVTDIISEDASLEQLFNSYTENGAATDATPPSSEEAAPPAEVQS